MIEKGLRGSALSLAFCSSIAMVSIFLIIVISVVLRKFFNAPLFFTEELVGLLMSVSLFLALPMVSLKRGHIRVTIVSDFLDNHQSAYTKHLFGISMLIGIAFTGWIFIESLPWMEFAIKRNIKTETARILLYPLMSAVPLSMGLCCLIYIARLFGLLPAEDK